MVSPDDVARLALALPGVSEGTSFGNRAWKVRGKGFVWERPFRKTDLARFAEAGDDPPTGPIVGVRVADLDEKYAVLASDLPGFFTIPHFDGYAAVLVQLDVAEPDDVSEAITDAWRAMAPKRLVDELDELDELDALDD